LNLIAIADRLGKTIEEIEKISVSEYNEWVAYFGLVEEMGKVQHGATGRDIRHPSIGSGNRSPKIG